jgi:hypothetical protein
MEPLRISRFDLPRLLRIGFFVLCTVAFIAYLLFQSRHLIRGPIITLDESLPTVTTERRLTVLGTTANIVSITLNGRSIFTDESGHFTETVVLENGYSILTIHALDRFGRGTSVTHGVWYAEPATTTTDVS